MSVFQCKMIYRIVLYRDVRRVASTDEKNNHLCLTQNNVNIDLCST